MDVALVFSLYITNIFIVNTNSIVWKNKTKDSSYRMLIEIVITSDKTAVDE